MEPIIPVPEFFFPGTFEVEPPYREGNEQNLHQGGLDLIDPSFDFVGPHGLGAIGFDPADYAPSLDSEETIEQNLPQWGPPFVKFVDDRISDLERNVRKEMAKWQYQTATYVFTSSVQTTGTGGLDQVTTPNCVLATIPPGWTYAIHRLEVTLPGNASFNFATPFNGAGGYWELRVNNEPRDGGSLVASAPLRPFGLPFILPYGTRDAIRARDGEVISFFLNAGPANTKIDLKLQGSYDRTIEG